MTALEKIYECTLQSPSSEWMVLWRCLFLAPMSRQIVSKTIFGTVRSRHVSLAMPLTNPSADRPFVFIDYRFSLTEGKVKPAALSVFL